MSRQKERGKGKFFDAMEKGGQVLSKASRFFWLIEMVEIFQEKQCSRKLQSD